MNICNEKLMIINYSRDLNYFDCYHSEQIKMKHFRPFIRVPLRQFTHTHMY